MAINYLETGWNPTPAAAPPSPRLFECRFSPFTLCNLPAAANSLFPSLIPTTMGRGSAKTNGNVERAFAEIYVEPTGKNYAASLRLRHID